MSHNIEDLAAAFFNAVGVGSERHPIELYKELEKVDLKEFLACAFARASPTYLDHLMFSTKKYWEVFSLEDWKSVMLKTAREELAIMYCLSFIYKYIGIDSLKLFAGLSGIDEGLRSDTLAYMERAKGLLAVFERVALAELKKFDLDLSSFEGVKARLIKEGASEAVKIHPCVTVIDATPWRKS
jgi:hypothetical protein